MQPDLLDLYTRVSAWTNQLAAGAKDKLDARTPCDEWDVRTLLNHMVDTQRYFVDKARGKDVTPPSPNPPDIVGADPAKDLESAQAELREAFSDPAVREKTGMALGIAFSDQLLHGWDLARATGQDATMPEGLAEGGYEFLHGRFTDEQRKGFFKPEVPVGPDASAQERLLAYTGRDPS